MHNEFDSGSEDVLPKRLRAHLARDFELEGEVGRGGMATVWRATRRRDQSTVAIKVLRPVLAEAVGARRFLREIEIAANTRSEFLVPLEESGQFDGLPYYVMPFIKGESLRQRLLREQQLPIAEVVRIGRGIATALAALHRNGIIHRDVKPENVMLREGHDVLVADYGIARALSSASNEVITSTGIVLGTPAYMSPEQAGGNVVDARTDQYSWGCMIYEMLLGVQPFHGLTSQQVIARHMHDAPPSLRVVRPAIPESLEAVVRKAMGKAPADRFTDFDALIETLDRVDLTDLTPISTSVRRRKRVAVATAAVVAVAAAVWFASTHPDPVEGRVVLFPLQPANSTQSEIAGRVSMVIRDALEDIEPERWVDGFALLNARPGTPSIDAARARSLSRRSRARLFITGTLAPQGAAADSVRVSVTLHDTERGADTTIVAIGSVAAATDVAVRAVVGLLPRLTGLERQINPASLFGRSPDVVSNWLRGEREYRSSRMQTAMTYLRRAIEADSSLAPAAIRGAMTAMWLNNEREATQYVTLAQHHREMLTTRQASFAEALRLYLVGAADSAVVALRHVLDADSTSAEHWMLAGELFLHLQPSVPLDSELVREVPAPVTWPLERWAESAFQRAQRVDSGFTASLPHLAQAAARRADLRTLESLQRRLHAEAADSVSLATLNLAHRCLANRMTRDDWTAATQSAPRVVFFLGVILTGATASTARACGDRAWIALLNGDSDPNRRFAAVVGRFASHASAGAHDSALAVVDSAVASGMNAALGLYILGAAAGIDPGSRADAFVNQLDAAIGTRPAPSLWLLALWSSRTGDTARLEKVRARLEVLKSKNGTRLDTLMAEVVAAYAALARGDTTRALYAFGRLAPRAPTSVVQGSLWESLAAERLVYARLLLATGSSAAAHRTASVFDQPVLYVNPLFLRPSLEIRVEAARALGDDGLRRAAEERLRALGPLTR
jgi:hypothetical protein